MRSNRNVTDGTPDRWIDTTRFGFELNLIVAHNGNTKIPKNPKNLKNPKKNPKNLKKSEKNPQKSQKIKKNKNKNKKIQKI